MYQSSLGTVHLYGATSRVEVHNTTERNSDSRNRYNVIKQFRYVQNIKEIEIFSEVNGATFIGGEGVSIG